MTEVRQMSRADRRAADAYLRSENAKWPEALKLWPREDWPISLAVGNNVREVYRSRGFLVQVYNEPWPVVARLSVIRSSLKPDGDWKEDITWEELQRLKREAGYGDFDAVEVYPPDADVVNVANLRHLWVFPAGYMPFAWRRKS